MGRLEHLVGNFVFRDVISHVVIGGTLEIYTDDKKAIIWIRNLGNPERNQRLIFRRLPIVSTIHLLVCAMREVLGQGIDVGHERIDVAMCDICRGAGWIEDEDGNRPDCSWCKGQGWVETE